tara:strand:- start:509 stop:763 length:255 start_codon:yes stop_codon:yes gene_type:complete
VLIIKGNLGRNNMEGYYEETVLRFKILSKLVEESDTPDNWCLTASASTMQKAEAMLGSTRLRRRCLVYKIVDGGSAKTITREAY